MGNLRKHLKIVRIHRKYVRRMCFKMGICLRGLLHDLSKYSIKELRIAKYYIGTKSPHQVARESLGYSPYWMYHKNRNKHHYQFWLDDTDGGNFIGVKIPYKYVIEMFCDMVGASKAYNRDKFTNTLPLNYYNNKCAGKIIMYDKSEDLLASLLTKYSEVTEKEFVSWYKYNKKEIKNKYIGE